MTLFITLKVANLHSFVRFVQDNTEIVDCGICEDFQKTNNIEFIDPADKDIDFLPFSMIRSQKDIEIYFYHLEFEYYGFYYNKPPPSLA
ncbi:hypothetical protein DHB64_01185 [Antarcticibacterium sp. W02-3]|nr:hypothetical protein [Antarcticibacterium sp. W02-3]